ncbi:hypothetical protein PFLUV_G00183360 [Perca fluviatilis]|uniref:Uncharacterized protein n=1 Tax=Perca fluviatilis TaxID=8168 RepID=A0A6A5EMN2_PERFL|nr:hypothetical protein PFLUV_G00183360 [Perca fluviatilis]
MLKPAEVNHSWKETSVSNSPPSIPPFIHHVRAVSRLVEAHFPEEKKIPDQATGAAAHPEHMVHDSQLDARLERIMDKTASKGRQVKVSHSGRFKEKKKVRATLAENPEMFPGGDAARDDNQMAEK